MIVSRTVTPLERKLGPQSAPQTAQTQDGAWHHGPSRPVADFRTERAYVLLGDPGSGKTTTFKDEARAFPDENHYITARRFLRANLDRHQEWRTKTLFIDGLDEVRAGQSNRRQPLDDILQRLAQLYYPRVRISCRSADWLSSDHREFAEEYSGLQILRLDPLTRTHAREITEAHGHSPDAVMNVVHDGGIDYFLTNPLLLQLLIAGQTNTEAAPGKAAILENACRTMARELNTDHQESALDLHATRRDDIWSTAGQLSALLLLTGKAYISLYQPEAADLDDCLLLSDVQGDQRVLMHSLRTKLFTGTVPGQMAPVHSVVAEYLAGRYLADQIIDDQGGVPANRVLALMCGPDNEVVPTLRGVAAWLATFVPTVRRRLIESDPWGVLAYGDSRGFDSKEKEMLLNCLVAQGNTALDLWNLSELAVAGIVGPDTIRIVRRYITSPDRSETAQRAIALLLRGIASRNAGQHDMTVEELLAVATEPSWSLDVRITALMAAVVAARHSGATEPLLRTLDDIRSGKVSDLGNELRGLLLRELYPDTVTPARVWHYYPDDTSTGVSGFWACLGEPEQSDPNDVATLLDGLVEQRHRFDPDLGCLAETAWKLLERTVESHGDQVPVGRLYDWIEAVAWDKMFREWRPSSDEVVDPTSRGSWTFRRLSIWPWLAERPAIQLALLEELYRRWCAQAAHGQTGWRELGLQLGTFEQLVCGRAYPTNYPAWCLEHAIRLANDEPEVARVLVERAGSHGWQQLASRQLLGPVVERVTEHPALGNYVQEIIDREERIANAIEKQQFQQHRRDRHLADGVHAHAATLSRGDGPPELLDQLAQAYLGVGRWQRSLNDHLEEWKNRESPLNHEPSKPMDRLGRALADDDKATAVAVHGLRLVPGRDDLPGPRQVLELAENNRRSLLAYPLLAAVADTDTRGIDVCAKSDNWIARSLMYYALTPLETLELPAWVDKLLTCRPEAVADALVLAGRSQIRRGVWDGQHLECLASEDRYATVAATTALRLARSVPTRCNSVQAGALQVALRVVLRHGTSTSDAVREVLKLVDTKSAVPGMDVKQVATWLVVGLRLEFDEYAARVIEFLDGGKTVRLRHMVRFLAGLGVDGLEWRGSQDVKALGDLVSAVAGRYEPWGLAAEQLVEGWTGVLAQNPDEAAGKTLQDIADRFGAWRDIVEPKHREWQINRRVAEYKIPEVREVQRTLRNGPPANSADLAALVVDKLEELARDIRNSNTDDWRQYWNEGRRRRGVKPRHGDSWEPKHEDSCRDALLSDLRRELLLSGSGVDAQPEGQYAEDKRADIRVAYGGHAIPVEIKKNTHRRLWSAINDQLIDQYVRAPESGGFGVYLVLWFGMRHTKVVPPTGRRPKTPAALRERLQEQLAPDKRGTIKVVVVDVSRPLTPPGAESPPPSAARHASPAS